MNPKHISAPLVVIATVSEKNRDNVISAMKSIGKQWREGEKTGQREVVFTWMDGERWSKWLKSMYGVVDAGTTGPPSVIVADHAVRVLRIIPSAVRTRHLRATTQNLVYYDTEPYGSKIQLTHSSIISTLESIAKGTIKAKNSENFFERTVRVSTFAFPWLPCLIFDVPNSPLTTGLLLLKITW